MKKIKTEYLIIGSGPGGAVTSSYLAQKGRGVVIAEEGQLFDASRLQDSYTIVDMIKKYRHGGVTTTLGRPPISYVEGKVVGGGSEINSGLYHRTPADVIEKWKKSHELREFDSNLLNPIFENIERRLQISKLGDKAPLSSKKLEEGARKLNWASQEVPRWFNPEGQRMSMSKTYIPDALKSGAQLVSNCRILKIKKEGAKYFAQSFDTEFEAEKVVFCAGATQTPTLLQKNGIGQNVGRYFQVHPTVKVIAQFKEKVNFENQGVPVHQIKEFAPSLTFGCAVGSPAFLSIGLLNFKDFHDVIKQWQFLASYYVSVSEAGAGSILTLPFLSEGLPRFQVSKDGWLLLYDGFKKLLKVLREAGATALFPSIVGIEPLYADQLPPSLDIEYFKKHVQLMTIHLFSTCPMGENKKICVTDSFGKIWNEKNIFINDASLLCSSPSVNPQGTIMATALRNTMKWCNDL